MSRHFSGLMADGIAEGSVRAVDPTIGGHAFVSAINAAADLRDWVSPEALPGYLKLFLLGISTGFRTFSDSETSNNFVHQNR